jgi:Spy/CpxP family protein refolding chaperone
MTKKLKPALLAGTLCCSLLAGITSVNAADNAQPSAAPATATPPATAKVDAPKPAAVPAAPGKPVASQVPPTAPPDPLQLTEPQKQKMADWRQLQQQHMQTMLQNQQTIEALSSAETYDAGKISKVAAELAEETKRYYEQYARKNRDFIDSLTPEQQAKAKQFREQRQQAMKQRLEQMKNSGNTTTPNAAPVNAAAPKPPVPAAAPVNPAPKKP